MQRSQSAPGHSLSALSDLDRQSELMDGMVRPIAALCDMYPTAEYAFKDDEPALPCGGGINGVSTVQSAGGSHNLLRS